MKVCFEIDKLCFFVIKVYFVRLYIVSTIYLAKKVPDKIALIAASWLLKVVAAESEMFTYIFKWSHKVHNTFQKILVGTTLSLYKAL